MLKKKAVSRPSKKKGFLTRAKEAVFGESEATASSAPSPPVSSKSRALPPMSKSSVPVSSSVGSAPRASTKAASSSSSRPTGKALAAASRGKATPPPPSASSSFSLSSGRSKSSAHAAKPAPQSAAPSSKSRSKGKKMAPSKKKKEKEKAAYFSDEDEAEDELRPSETSKVLSGLQNMASSLALSPPPSSTKGGYLSDPEYFDGSLAEVVRKEPPADLLYEPFEGMALPPPQPQQQQQQQQKQQQQQQQRAYSPTPVSRSNASGPDLVHVGSMPTSSRSPLAEGASYGEFEGHSSLPPTEYSERKAERPMKGAKKAGKKGKKGSKLTTSGAGSGSSASAASATLKLSPSGRHLLNGSGEQVGTFPWPIPAELPFIPRSSLALNPKPVGAGSFGVVYACEYASQKVAVKVPNAGPPDLVLEQVDGIFKELTIQVRATTHPHVVRFIGVSWVTPPPDVMAMIESPLGLGRLEMPWVVMEYMDGGDVLQYVRQSAAEGRTLPAKEMARLAKEAALGLAHLHSQGIVHRDVACRNLMMHAGSVKIGDFGLARVVANPYAMGGTSSKVGPLKWEAPETVLTRVYGPASDVYSFGVSLFEIVTGGKEPWEGLEPVQAALAVTQGQSLAASLPPTVDPRLADVIRRCIVPVAHDRPKLSAIAEELAAFV